ncbi:hypothetical protein [Pseudonocardia sp.]|uniref:hypothetical protein n=1 Tax=Pseudonocardia sp. TaxID=60912 RepID=UPI0031FCC7F1
MRNKLIHGHDGAGMRRALAVTPLLLLIGACGSSVDSWANEQAHRLTQAGVTYPPEQERNIIVNMVSACVFKENGDDEAPAVST